MINRYHHSGNHGGKPMWHFVAPVLTLKPELQHLYLKHAGKRWDSLAFKMMFDQIEVLKTAFCKIIPNGKGGTPGNTATCATPGATLRDV
jgi:hypothetical protein